MFFLFLNVLFGFLHFPAAIHPKMPKHIFHLKHKENISREIHPAQPKATGCPLWSSRLASEEKFAALDTADATTKACRHDTCAE